MQQGITRAAYHCICPVAICLLDACKACLNGVAVCLIEVLVIVKILLEHHRIAALDGKFVCLLLLLLVCIIEIIAHYASHHEGKDKADDKWNIALFLLLFRLWLRLWSGRLGVCRLHTGVYRRRNRWLDAHVYRAVHHRRRIMTYRAQSLILEIHLSAFLTADDITSYTHTTTRTSGCFLTYLMSTLWTFYYCHFVYFVVLLF